MCHKYWVHTLELVSSNYWAHVLQWLKPVCLELVLCNKESHSNKSVHSNRPKAKKKDMKIRVCVCVCVCACAQSTHSCLTLCDPVDCSLPGCSVHGIFQAGILQWVAISYSRGFSQPRDWRCISYVSCIGRQILYQTYRENQKIFIIGDDQDKCIYFDTF